MTFYNTTNETKAPSVDEIRGSFSLREASEGGIVYALNKHPTGFLSAAKMLHSHVGALLDEKMSSLVAQNASLQIPRPQGDWIVDGIPPQSIQGRYFPAGEPIVTLVSERQRYVEVIVDQRDIYLLDIGNEGRIRFVGVGPNIYDAKVQMISPVAKLEGIEQSLTVRMGIELGPDSQIPPLGLSGDILIFGEHTPLWRHFFHTIRKVLRADLWL
ncbi:MAG: HlyD family secretion protein [Psychrosphaera sp.]|nr:HlyD family secretion protein [Psychrosphaera sp.]